LRRQEGRKKKKQIIGEKGKKKIDSPLMNEYFGLARFASVMGGKGKILILGML
jgi:hypothetical protein